MNHTWADVAYGFVNGSGVKGDMSPLEFVAMECAVAALVYMYWRFR